MIKAKNQLIAWTKWWPAMKDIPVLSDLDLIIPNVSSLLTLFLLCCWGQLLLKFSIVTCLLVIWENRLHSSSLRFFFSHPVAASQIQISLLPVFAAPVQKDHISHEFGEYSILFPGSHLSFFIFHFLYELLRVDFEFL